jgi:TRAP-type C4-dicarboxylate transport system permease small subunit
MEDALDNVSRQLARILYWIAGIAIVAMMLLTCADILLRGATTLYRNYQWGFLSSFKPIPGTYELVCFLGTVAVAFAMAHTSVEKGHVAVSLIVRLFPEKVQALIGSFTTVFSLILFAILSWRSFLYASHMKEIGEVSMTLQLPFYPFVYGISFAAAALCLVLLSDLVKNLKAVFGK